MGLTFHRRTEKAFHGHSEALSISPQHRQIQGESTAQDRIQWRSYVQDGSNVFENERVATAEKKKENRKKSNPIATTIGIDHHQSYVYRV